jgi:hypothetical protein
LILGKSAKKIQLYSHEIVINTTGHDLNITRIDEELTEEASCGDLQSEEDLSYAQI